MTTLDPATALTLGDIARRLATEAGEIALARQRAGVTVEATKSSRADVVTAADLEVEEWIRGRLAELRPDDAVLGEESGAGRGTSGLTWIVDPIDGTVNFLYGIDAWAVSVAVCEGPPEPSSWTLVAGAVAAPALGAVWHATSGHGAYRDGRQLAPRAYTELDVALVATGFGYTSARRARQGRVVADVLPRVRDIRRIGSAAIDLCLVAEGTVDAYYEAGVNPWDIAAGALVLAEAGGRMLTPEWPGEDGLLVVAGHGGTEARLAELLNESCGVDSRGV